MLSMTPADVAAIAKAADVDERSVWKALAGGSVRGRAGARIARVLAQQPNSEPSVPRQLGDAAA